MFPGSRYVTFRPQDLFRATSAGTIWLDFHIYPSLQKLRKIDQTFWFYTELLIWTMGVQFRMFKGILEKSIWIIRKIPHFLGDSSPIVRIFIKVMAGYAKV